MGTVYQECTKLFSKNSEKKKNQYTQNCLENIQGKLRTRMGPERWKNLGKICTLGKTSQVDYPLCNPNVTYI